MKLLNILKIGLIFAVSSLKAQEKAPYTIQGTIVGVQDNGKGKVFLQRYDNEFGLDSVQLEKGKFRFTGKTDGPEMANLFYVSPEGKRSNTLDFYIEKGSISIKAESGQFENANIEGSQLNSDSKNFNTTHKTVLDSIAELTKKYFEAEEILSRDSFSMESPARESIKKIDVVLNKWSATLNKEQSDYIRNNPNKAFSLFLLQRLLKDSANQNLVVELYEKLDLEIKNTPVAQQLKTELDALSNLNIGDIAPQFSLNDMKGKEIQLSQLKGKYVLIDFWASWCIPCRVENEHVQKAYKKFKNSGFEVIGISTDFVIKNWIKAVIDDGMSWINVVDPESTVSNLYHVKSIPSNFLLDPTGKIIGINLRGDALYEALKNIF